MQDFINFLIRHWELALAFVMVLLYWVTSEIIEAKSGRGVLPSGLVHLLNREKAILIDIREPALFEEGHILGALSFPEKSLFDQLNKIKKHQAKPIILIDNNGATAQKHINKLIAEGYEKSMYLKNGMQAWLQSKLPVEKGKSNAKD